MPYALLERLCSATLPETIGAQAEIEKLRFLLAQGLVEADIPHALIERGHRCYAGNAIVMCVSQKGHLVANHEAPRVPAPDICSASPERPSAPSPFL